MFSSMLEMPSARPVIHARPMVPLGRHLILRSLQTSLYLIRDKPVFCGLYRVKALLSRPDSKCRTYVIYTEGLGSASLCSVSVNRKTARTLFRRLVQGRVTPEDLQNTVEDWCVGQILSVPDD